MHRVSFRTDIPTVTEVTVTLTPDEVRTIAEALDGHGLNAMSGQWRGLLDPEPNTNAYADLTRAAMEWFVAGRGDDLLYSGRYITAIKNCRAATGCGLLDAKQACDARRDALGLN